IARCSERRSRRYSRTDTRTWPFPVEIAPLTDCCWVRAWSAFGRAMGLYLLWLTRRARSDGPLVPNARGRFRARDYRGGCLQGIVALLVPSAADFSADIFSTGS